MANTINKNVIVPEVYAELVREKIAGKTKVAQFAKVLGDLQGKEGETLTMPKWGYIGDATDWAMNTPMVSTQMTQTRNIRQNIMERCLQKMIMMKRNYNLLKWV